jgi:hypothetical protein
MKRTIVVDNDRLPSHDLEPRRVCLRNNIIMPTFCLLLFSLVSSLLTLVRPEPVFANRRVFCIRSTNWPSTNEAAVEEEDDEDEDEEEQEEEEQE